MTQYLQLPVHLKKAQWLIENTGATRLLHSPLFVSPPHTSDLAIVCVVENGPFDAAALIESSIDCVRWSDPMDARTRTWLEMNRETALKFVG